MQLNLLPTIQQAIASLLTVYEPEFLRFGYSLFLSFATILIVWQGVKMMFSHDSLGDSMFEFAKLLMLISFGYSFITFYEAPLPGIGVSFSNLSRTRRPTSRACSRPVHSTTSTGILTTCQSIFYSRTRGRFWRT